MSTKTAIAAAVFAFLVSAGATQAHNRPGPHNALHAIAKAWCGNDHILCPAAVEAINVSYCETGGTFSVWAENGQYLGMFQMGSSERAQYGHGNTPWAQAQAAHRYYVASGRDWSPWECKPWNSSQRTWSKWWFKPPPKKHT